MSTVKKPFLDLAYEAIRGSPNDLRTRGLSVAIHNDYFQGEIRHTFWLMTCVVEKDSNGKAIIRAFRGEGKTDGEALDQIRAAFAEVMDPLHHAPSCPANHYHGTRAPAGPCSCGAAEVGLPSK